MSTVALRGTNYAFSRTTECLALLTTDAKLRIFETGAAGLPVRSPYFRLARHRIGKMLSESTKPAEYHRSTLLKT